MQTSVLSSNHQASITLYLFTLIALASVLLAPLTAAAAEKPKGSITDTTLSTESTKPTLRGKASGTKQITVTIYKQDSSKSVYEKKNLTVKKSGEWNVNVSKPLPKGLYDVKVTTGTGKSKRTLDNELLAIGKSAISKKKASSGSKDSSKDKANSGAKSDGTLTVTTVPLLSGGTVNGGESIPISYLQVRNASKEAVTVTGFTVKQNGTASANLITSLSTSDNVGESRATSKTNPFKDGSGFVPTKATIAPGGFKIFTLKATMAANVSSSYGKNFMLDVTNVQTNGKVKTTYPLRGTVWTVGF